MQNQRAWGEKNPKTINPETGLRQKRLYRTVYNSLYKSRPTLIWRKEGRATPHSRETQTKRREEKGSHLRDFSWSQRGPRHVISGIGTRLISTDGPTWFCSTALNLTRLISAGSEPDRAELSPALGLGTFLRCSPTLQQRERQCKET